MLSTNNNTPGTTISSSVLVNNSVANSNLNNNQALNKSIAMAPVVATHLPLSATKINQLIPANNTSNAVATNLSSSPATPTSSPSIMMANANQISSSTNHQNSNTLTNSVQINGFAHCINCNEYGVKAAFYGKSKLYCSVACQNGIKKQQLQQNHGTKRTIEALSHSPIANSALHCNTNSNSTNTNLSSLILVGNAANTTSNLHTNLNNLQTQQISSPVQPFATNIHQSLPSINTITVLSLPQAATLSPQQTSKNINPTANTIPPNNPSLLQSNPSANQNVQILNENSMTTLKPLNNNNNTSNLFSLNENSTVLVGLPTSSVSSLPCSNNLNSIETNNLKNQQVPKLLQSSVVPQENKTPNGNSAANGVESTSTSSTSLPPAKRPRHNSVNSTISNTGSSLSTSSRHEAKSSIHENSGINGTTSLIANPIQETIIKTSSSLKHSISVNSSSPRTNNRKLSTSSNTTTSSSIVSSTTTTTTTTATSTARDTSPVSFDWPSYIEKENVNAAPVQLFKHVPLSYHFEAFTQNLKVEVKNKFPPPGELLSGLDAKFANKSFYWYATVIKYAGYYVKLRYLGYDQDDSADFWVHVCAEPQEIHSVGYACLNDCPIIAPYPIYEKIPDVKQYIIEQLTGADTLPSEYETIVKESLKSKFKKGMILELVDKKKLSRMRVARIIDNIGGRLRMKYENSEDFDDFWCHELSELIHPVGWSMQTGHDLYATEDYKRMSLKNIQNRQISTSAECTPDMFRKVRPSQSLQSFKVNMKLETIDPLVLSSIRVATVSKVLKNDYLIIRIDGAGENDMFCYHRSSSAIFPAGFCQNNNLQLHPPYGYQGQFTWEKYLKDTNSEFAPIDSFYSNNSKKNPFEKGMKLESVDLMEPKMICAATVADVVDRLILLSFDGWDNQFDQWVDWESCDIYPIGWAKFVGYPLEAIRKAETGVNPLSNNTKAKRTRKTTGNNSKRK